MYPVSGSGLYKATGNTGVFTESSCSVPGIALCAPVSKTGVILRELQVLGGMLAKEMQNECVIKTETNAVKEKKTLFFFVQ